MKDVLGLLKTGSATSHGTLQATVSSLAPVSGWVPCLCAFCSTKGKLAAGTTGEDASKKEDKPVGPIGGVQPGLHGDEDKVIEGPEPLMGVKHLDAVEKGKLAAGSNAVSLVHAASIM